jgi:APA family basic amino acid/polyamine antiporter
MGFWMCLALVIGNMIGSGVFLLPSSLAPYGLNSVMGWVLTALGSLLLASVFSVLSRAFPEAHGPYAYTRLAFGDLTGFIVAWGYWVAVWVGNAAVATASVSYLSNLMPWIVEMPGAATGVTLSFVWLFTAVNLRGARETGAVQILTTILKLLPLLAVSGLGIFLISTGDTRLNAAVLQNHAFTWDAVTASATLTLWAFLGLESAAVATEKVINPERNIPLATLWGTLIAAFVYVVSCTVVILLIPSDQLGSSNAPFADAVTPFWGSGAAHWLALFAAISGLGALSGWILVQGEMPYQMAKAGVFPKAFAKTNSRGAPVVGLLVSGVLLSIVVLINGGKTMVQIFTFLLLISTSATLVMYLLCALAALWLHSRGRLVLKGSVAVFAAISVMAAVYALWALLGAGKEAVLWGFLLLGCAVPVYYAMRWHHQKQI